MAPKDIISQAVKASLHQNGHANTHQNGHNNFSDLTQSQFTTISQNILKLENLINKFQQDSTSLMDTMKSSVSPQQIQKH